MNRNGIKRLLACVGLAAVLICGMDSGTIVQAANQIKLNKTCANIAEGKSLQLSISGTNSKVKWSSSQKSVAKVDSSGKVTAKNPGTSIITARVNNQSFQCNVTVPVPVMNKETALLFVGDTLKLKLKKTGKGITWKSDNDEIAMVSSKGKVVARSAGTTIITATANKKSYVCEITVVDIRDLDVDDGAYDDAPYDDKWEENEDISEYIEEMDSGRDWDYEENRSDQEDEADDFREDEVDSFREDGVDGFQEDEADGFREDEAESVKEDEVDGFQENEVDGFQENEVDGFQENEVDGFQEDEVDGFQEDEADGFREDEAERINEDEADRNAEEEKKNEYTENPAVEKLKEYIRRRGAKNSNGDKYIYSGVSGKYNRSTSIILNSDGSFTFEYKNADEGISVYMSTSMPAENYVVLNVCYSDGDGISSYMRMNEYIKKYEVFPYKRANDAVQKAFESWDAFVRAKDINGMNALGFSSYF